MVNVFKDARQTGYGLLLTSLGERTSTTWIDCPYWSKKSIYKLSLSVPLRQVGAQSSMSRKGNLYDKAMIEPFYKRLKRELINDALFETRAEATQEILKYIETYYNTKRMHSALDYKSSKDFEKYNS